jgi:hypothetical protein
MAEQRTITIGRKTYPILYSANALRRLERETGHPTSRVGLLLLTGQGGFDLLQCVLWAGLEGARLKNITRPNPFTVDEVGDMIDDLGGPETAWDIEAKPPAPMAIAVLEAWQSAFPKQQRKDLPKGDEGKNDEAPSPEQTSGGATDATPQSPAE